MTSKKTTRRRALFFFILEYFNYILLHWFIVSNIHSVQKDFIMTAKDKSKQVPSKVDETFPVMLKRLGYVPEDYALIAIKDNNISYCFEGNLALLADLCPIMEKHIRDHDTTTMH